MKTENASPAIFCGFDAVIGCYLANKTPVDEIERRAESGCIEHGKPREAKSMSSAVHALFLALGVGRLCRAKEQEEKTKMQHKHEPAEVILDGAVHPIVQRRLDALGLKSAKEVSLYIGKPLFTTFLLMDSSTPVVTAEHGHWAHLLEFLFAIGLSQDEILEIAFEGQNRTETVPLCPCRARRRPPTGAA